LVAVGLMELMSMTIFPSEKLFETPFSPSTRSTSGVFGSIVMITSLFRAASVGVVSTPTPASDSSEGEERLRDMITVDHRPQVFSHWSPMSPRPMNPIFMIPHLIPSLRET
jgi:hypothetical protein